MSASEGNKTNNRFHADLNAALSDATRRDPDSSVYFRVSPSNLPQLETFLADVDVSRFTYDSVTELACLEMTETALHSVVGFDLSVLLLAVKDRIRDQIRAAFQARGGMQSEPDPAPATSDDDKAAVVHRLTKVRPMGTTTIHVPGKSDNKQPDFSFRELKLDSAESKCCLYSKAGIHFVLLIDIQYPDADQATVSLRVAEPGGDEAPYWALHREPFLLSSGDQPVGGIDPFASDFLGGSRGVPEEFRRLQDQDHAESAAQASESVQTHSLPFSHWPQSRFIC
ncbi:hypothetical protein CMUS01_09711 [Colletotrichum musicola]|uniref:Uncharacterized protein n=1 Tax=Colletotrichum musicola TaxID=2175873 RepID=A0A8H6NAK0_9PEZI|nr:hypothetical protein CMUS01_09711 [Colletotrichum musicola]